MNKTSVRSNGLNYITEWQLGDGEEYPGINNELNPYTGHKINLVTVYFVVMAIQS